MAEWRLTKNNCEDIAFAISCLAAGVISFDEFKQWLYLVVETTGDVPHFIWDITELNDRYDFIPLKIMGFTPHWVHTNDEDDAVDGIGYKRWSSFASDASSRRDALEKLSTNPHIEERFRNTFPFIQFA